MEKSFKEALVWHCFATSGNAEGKIGVNEQIWDPAAVLLPYISSQIAAFRSSSQSHSESLWCHLSPRFPLSAGWAAGTFFNGKVLSEGLALRPVGRPLHVINCFLMTMQDACCCAGCVANTGLKTLTPLHHLRELVHLCCCSNTGLLLTHSSLIYKALNNL